MSEQGNRRSRYRSIKEETRQELIRRIVQNGQNIKDISHELGLNISTCKAIVKVYQEEGRIGKKKKRNKIVNVIETYSFYSIDGMKLQQIGAIKLEEAKISLNKDQNLQKILTQKTSIRAQQLIQQAIQTKNKVDQILLQQQIIQSMGSNIMYFPHMRFY